MRLEGVMRTCNAARILARNPSTRLLVILVIVMNRRRKRRERERVWHGFERSISEPTVTVSHNTQPVKEHSCMISTESLLICFSVLTGN